MHFNDLPVEIIFIIFNNLDIYSRCFARRVCRLWDKIGSDLQLQLALEILNPTPPRFLRKEYHHLPSTAIWWTPKFLYSNEKILESVVRLHIGRNELISDYTHSTQNADYNLSPIGITNILTHSKQVETLTFNGYFPFTTRCLTALQELKKLKELKFTERELISFPIKEFTGPPSLEKLTITKYSIHLSGLLNFLSAALPYNDDIYSDYQWNDILVGGYGKLGSSNSLLFKPPPISLKYLHLSKCDLHSYFKWAPMKSLEHLIIEDCSIFGQPLLMLPMVESASNLQSISFFGSKFLHALGSEAELSEQLLTVLQGVITKVKYFGISHKTITFEQILMLIENSNQLQTLKIESCIENILHASNLFSDMKLNHLKYLEIRCALPNLNYQNSLTNSQNGLLREKNQFIATQLFEKIPMVSPKLKELKITSYRGTGYETEELIVDDHLLKSFSSLIHLKKLFLSSVQQISLKGLQELISSLPKLNFLHLGRTISDYFGTNEVSQLRNLFPSIQIEFNPLIINNIQEPHEVLQYKSICFDLDHCPDSTCSICESVPCPFGCYATLKSCVIYDHSQLCSELKRFCPSGCGLRLKPREFASHYIDCPRYRITCFGCQFEYQGKEYYQHRVDMDEDNWKSMIPGCLFRNFPYQCLNQCSNSFECSCYIIVCPACKDECSYEHYINSHQNNCVQNKTVQVFF